MKAKKSSLICLSILSLVILMNFVSAAVIYTPTELIGSADSGTTASIGFNMENDYASDLDDISFVFTNLVKDSLSISSSNLEVIGVTSTTEILSTENLDVTLNIAIPSSQGVGVYEGSVEVFGDIGSGPLSRGTLNITLTVTEPVSTSSEPSEITACTTIGNPNNNLKIKDIDITNKGMKMGDDGATKEFGDDDAWFPLDDIEVEIEIENNGEEKIEDIEIEWGLYDTQANVWIIELEDEKDFDLKKDKDDVTTISFNLENDLDVDLEDLDDGDHYKFYVTATGMDTEPEPEEQVCVTDSEDVEIVIESDFLVLDDFQIPVLASCGGEVQIAADLWNIGDEDQEDVYVLITELELGINHKRVDIGDVDAFDKETLDVILDIPEDADEKIYGIEFEVYDEDDEIFENDFDDDPAEFEVLLDISGSCSSTTGDAVVSASLESGGKAGEELVVKATIVNTGSESASYSINAAGYSSWASSAESDVNVILLDKGESKDVMFTFNVKDDVSGEQAFDIEVVSDSELVLKQPVSVTIEDKQDGGLSGITGSAIGESNAYLWGIGFLNVILVVVIIIVAVRVARR